jgi:hypothetical protein
MRHVNLNINNKSQIKTHGNQNGRMVVHITHNFGGGCATYIDNMIHIFNNYRHIVLNIMGANKYQIDRKMINTNDIKWLIRCKPNLLIFHHLLYNDGAMYKINENVLNNLIKSSAKKIFIAHDYFLFYPATPNPIKKELKEPDKNDIIRATKILNMMDMVYFNSKNTANNYAKYIDLDVVLKNRIILNEVPDIDLYGERIHPIKKNIHTIAILGHLSAPHKGKHLAESIFGLFSDKPEYKFVVLGDYAGKYNNVILNGSYTNSNIFDLIKKYNVSYFMFVSTFEETYSFTLSIALRTGLPIIYNNIGAYVDRLKEYDNCHSFEEDNIGKICDILEVLKNKNCDHNHNRSDRYILNENLPEFSQYLTNGSELNFILKVIRNNLKHRNVCFVHLTNMNDGMKIFMEQIKYIKDTKLYDRLDYIFVTLLGEHVQLPYDYKIKLIYYSKNPEEWEFPTIQRIKYFADTIADTIADSIADNVNILYIHTKGVLQKPYSYEWRKYLEYFLIGLHEICLDSLKYYNCVGVNQQFYYTKENCKKNHFSGNFWWSRSQHIKNLPKFTISPDRYYPEHYLIGDFTKTDPRYYVSLHHTDKNLYEYAMIPEQYNLELIKNPQNFAKNKNIYGVYFICCIGQWYDVVCDQLKKLVDSGLYCATDKIICFVCLADNRLLEMLKTYQKIVVIHTKENLYEKYALNNFKKYLDGDYYMYYIHSKSVTRKEKCYSEWRDLCDYFTIEKWHLNLKLLEYYDCVGVNLKNFPKIHFSGNYWWSRSDHLKKLKDVDDKYLSPEFYVCSYEKTNKICIFESGVTHGNTLFPKSRYVDFDDQQIIDGIRMVPQFNIGDRHL